MLSKASFTYCCSRVLKCGGDKNIRSFMDLCVTFLPFFVSFEIFKPSQTLRSHSDGYSCLNPLIFNFSTFSSNFVISQMICRSTPKYSCTIKFLKIFNHPPIIVWMPVFQHFHESPNSLSNDNIFSDVAL